MCVLIYQNERYKTDFSVPSNPNFETDLYFNLEKYGIKTVDMCDGSSDFVVYKIENGCLFLKDYYFLMLPESECPEINGVHATQLKRIILDGNRIVKIISLVDKKDTSMFNFAYYNINLKIDYTGHLFIKKNYVTTEVTSVRKFSAIWEYEKVLELVFENGTLTETINHSELCAQIRDMVNKNRFFINCLKQYRNLPCGFSVGNAELPWWITTTLQISVNDPFSKKTWYEIVKFKKFPNLK